MPWSAVSLPYWPPMWSVTPVLIRADKEGTLAALKVLRVDLIDLKIAGDNLLVEFASVVDVAD